MIPRIRVLIGIVIMIVGLTVGALLVMRAASIVPDHPLAQLLFYAFAGTVWVWPAAKLTAWMQKDV